MAGKTILRKSDCRPIKERITAVEKRIREVEDDLTDPDISARIKKRLRQDLKQLKLLLRHLTEALKGCEALAARPSPR